MAKNVKSQSESTSLRRSTKRKSEKKKQGKKSKVPNPFCDPPRKKTRKELQHIAEQYTRRIETIPEDVIVLPKHLQDWVNKNAQPKKPNVAKYKCKREPSRWAKRGPMIRRDWLRFYDWAEKKAVAKTLPVSSIPEQQERKKLKPGKAPRPLEDVIEHLDRLAEPVKPRKKYEFKPPSDYPYAPQIDLKKPAKKDKGRPFPKPKVPKYFADITLELDFWRGLRFPVRRAALYYKASTNIERLALPRVRPPAVSHCPIPEKPKEYVPPRRRMTYRQWRNHKRRLEYLAEPVYRPMYV